MFPPPFESAAGNSSCMSPTSCCGKAPSYLCHGDGVYIGPGLFCKVKKQMSRTAAVYRTDSVWTNRASSKSCDCVCLYDFYNYESFPFAPLAAHNPITSVPLVSLWSQTCRGHREGGWREQKHSHAAELWPSLPPSPDSTPDSLILSPKKKKKTHTHKNVEMIKLL